MKNIKRRTPFEIVDELLKTLLDGPQLQTKIMSLSNLQYTAFVKYSDYLLDKKFIEIQEHPTKGAKPRRTYTLTSEGWAHSKYLNDVIPRIAVNLH